MKNKIKITIIVVSILNFLGVLYMGFEYDKLKEKSHNQEFVITLLKLHCITKDDKGADALIKELLK